MKTLLNILLLLPFFAYSQQEIVYSHEKIAIIKVGTTQFPAYPDSVEIYVHEDTISTCGLETIALFKEKIDAEFMSKVHAMIFDYYKESYADYYSGATMYDGSSEGLEEWLPDPNKIDDIRPYITAMVIWIPKQDLCEIGFFGIEFDCSWDIEHACGVRIKNWEPETVGFAFDAYCDY